MIKPFARVDFSERDNYLRYLANTDMYKDKIVFVEGNDSTNIPNEIYVGPTKYADASGTFGDFVALNAWEDYIPPTTIAPPVQ